MPELLLYLLKVNVALVLFYGAYYVALRRLTCYHLNRLFLVFGLVFSTVYPFVDVSSLFAHEQQIASTYLATLPEWASAIPTAPPASDAFDYWQLPVYLFWVGVAAMSVRFILQLVSLYRIHAASAPATYQAVPFRKAASILQPFSFWQTIYLNPAQHRPEELASILRHELIHITGWHTLDVLLAELSVILYWFNPGAWLLKKAMKENLEFIADQQVVRAGMDRKAYQYLLLKVVGATQPQIANQFNFPSLKRRIAMMNKMPTRKTSQLRLLIVLPLAASLLFAFRTTTPVAEAITSIESEIMQQDGKNTEELIKQLKKNRAIKSVRTKKIDGRDAILISPKGSGTEVYYMGDAASIAELERKYGLPKLPPPPPVGRNLPAQPSVQEKTELKRSVPESVVYYLDGVKATKEEAEQLKPEAIHSIDVVKGEQAKKIPGNTAGRYVISLTTKANKDSEQVRKFQEKLPQRQEQSGTRPAPETQEENLDEPYFFKLDQVPYYKEKSNWPADYKEFLKRNPSVKQVAWRFNNRREHSLESIVFLLENGKVETYDYNGSPRIPAAEAKYGQLPQLPPPPPPVKAN